MKALTYCGLQQLSSQGLAEVLRLYPEYAAAFRAGLPQDLTFNLHQGSDTNVCRPRMASISSKVPSFKADIPQSQRGPHVSPSTLKMSSLNPRHPCPLPLPYLTSLNPTHLTPLAITQPHGRSFTTSTSNSTDPFPVGHPSDSLQTPQRTLTLETIPFVCSSSMKSLSELGTIPWGFLTHQMFPEPVLV